MGDGVGLPCAAAVPTGRGRPGEGEGSAWLLPPSSSPLLLLGRASWGDRRGLGAAERGDAGACAAATAAGERWCCCCGLGGAAAGERCCCRGLGEATPAPGMSCTTGLQT